MSALPNAVETLPETLTLSVAAATDPAGREENEDVAIAEPIVGDVYLLVVADGMGGHPAGDVASRIAVDALRQALAERASGEDDLGLALKQAYRRANEAVFQAGQEEPTYGGMGTTLVAALLRGKYAAVANVGDSRAYLLRGDGLTQVTRDHTMVADEVGAGRLSADAARRDPRRNILTHAIGTQPRLETRLPNIFELTLLPGDRLLLCSDGLYDVLDDADMRRALLDEDPDTAARDLVETAKARGTHDNVAAVVAAAIPTRISVPSVLPARPARTGGLPVAAIAGAVAVLLIALLVLAVVALGVAP